MNRYFPPLASRVTAHDELCVGSVPVSRLAARVGSTPFFAYDRGEIDRRVLELRAALPGDVRISYAVKANPMPAVVQHLARRVDGFDVASAAEMALALDTGHDPARVSFAGPGKTAAEIRRAVAAGITVEIESMTQAEHVLGAAAELDVAPRCVLRVNPDFGIKGSGMRMGGGSQQFGIDAECVPEMLRALGRKGLDVIGFHVFAGSQNLHADLLVAALGHTIDLVLRLAEHARAPITKLNLGGGFGIPYGEKDAALAIAPIGEALGEQLAHRIKPRLGGVDVTLELGRYLVGESGVYVTRVVDRKCSRGRTYLVVDGGMHHQLAASGNLGQVIRRNYPIAVGSRVHCDATAPVTVVGSLCTPLDILGDAVLLPHADVGDLIVVFQAGAYGLTASPTAFLSHPTPLEVLV